MADFVIRTIVLPPEKVAPGYREPYSAQGTDHFYQTKKKENAQGNKF